jgi:adenylate cyclase
MEPAEPLEPAQSRHQAEESVSISALAARAGTTEARVRRLVELRILLPLADGAFRPGHVHDVRLALAFEDAGMSLEAIARAIEQGHLSLAASELIFSRHFTGTSASTMADVAAELDVDVDTLRRFYEATGLPTPEPDDFVRADDADVIPYLIRIKALVGDEAGMLRAARMYGENLRRIADAEPDFYHAYIEEPMLGAGLTDQQARDLAAEVSPELQATVERLMLWVYRRHQEHGIVGHVIEHVESVLEGAGLATRQERPPAMCFLDLTGYTRLTEERGDEAAAQTALELAGLVHECSGAYGGRPIKWLGDGVMFHYREPGAAVLSALDMVKRVPAAGLPPAHVGLAAGRVVFREGDYYGRTVNAAARIAAHAGPGEVLVTTAVREASGRDGVRFDEIGPVTLKGFVEPVVLHRAVALG